MCEPVTADLLGRKAIQIDTNLSEKHTVSIFRAKTNAGN
jgi:hypothetical protein